MKSCSVSDGLAIFKALGSPVRVQILRLIQKKEGLNIKQIAQSLKIPVTTLSPHLNLLAEAGLLIVLFHCRPPSCADPAPPSDCGAACPPVPPAAASARCAAAWTVSRAPGGA